MTAVLDETSAPVEQAVDFLWLEITNGCNLRCVHCYAESGPDQLDAARLATPDYERLLDEGWELGCRQVQFIGGEPTLNRDLPRLIHHARMRGYSTVEVYTNLVRLPADLLRAFVEHRVSVATSFYSARPEVHDAITRSPGSFGRTLRNIRSILAAGLTLRAGIIEMDENRGLNEETVAFLRAQGIEQVGVDRLRKFGRAQEGEECAMTELCGSCAGRTLCVGPDGAVSPCIMSKAWSVGSVLESSLGALARSARLGEIRSSIYREVVAPREAAGEAAGINRTTPITSCGPCEPQGGTQCIPWCSPGQQCIPCSPNGSSPCIPNGRCNPR